MSRAFSAFWAKRNGGKLAILRHQDARRAAAPADAILAFVRSLSDRAADERSAHQQARSRPERRLPRATRCLLWPRSARAQQASARPTASLFSRRALACCLPEPIITSHGAVTLASHYSAAIVRIFVSRGPPFAADCAVLCYTPFDARLADGGTLAIYQRTAIAAIAIRQSLASREATGKPVEAGPGF